MVKKSIILFDDSSSGWMGGVYYIRNIAFELSLNDFINSKYNIYLFTSKNHSLIFKDLPNNIKVIYGANCNGKLRKIQKAIAILKYNAEFMFPKIFPSKIFQCKSISWIPDFQFVHYPDYFSKECKDNNLKKIYYIEKNNLPLVLSSEDVLKDLNSLTNKPYRNVYVVHFVSYISEMVNNISEIESKKVLKKYGISKIYTCVMNQFWQHKNHLTLFCAFDEFVKKYNYYDKCLLVCTGLLQDDRNPEYINKLKQVIDSSPMKKQILILGLIDRNEQIIIMKYAHFLIQPSLFEGWGTVVEDAKVMDKRVLLSDIPVHREQMTSRCTLFNPEDENDLVRKMYDMFQEPFDDDAEKGIKDMYLRARSYSKSFEQCIKNNAN